MPELHGKGIKIIFLHNQPSGRVFVLQLASGKELLRVLGILYQLLRRAFEQRV